MLILALDTTTRAGSIALARDQAVLAVVSGDASRTHAERLPADIVRMLAAQHVEVGQIDLFAVAAGPGSFTGLRIGIATVQGLAFALARPVVSVSTLDTLAHVAADSASGVRSPESGVDAGRRTPDTGRLDHLLFAAFMDAQRSEVFAALYRLEREAGQPATERRFSVLDGPVSEPPSVVLRRWKEISTGQIWFAGDGLDRYRALAVESLGPRFRAVDPLPPLAPVIAQLAYREASAGRTVAPHGVRPVYVRRPDAELARERPSTAAPGRSRGGEPVKPRSQVSGDDGEGHGA